MLSAYSQFSSLGKKVGSTQETKLIILRPFLVSSIKDRHSYCLSIHTVMKESTEFYSENTKRKRHLSDSRIGTKIVLRYEEIGLCVHVRVCVCVCERERERELDSTVSG